MIEIRSVKIYDQFPTVYHSLYGYRNLRLFRQFRCLLVPVFHYLFSYLFVLLFDLNDLISLFQDQIIPMIVRFSLVWLGKFR